ncbi:MAG: DKNYY domain-containing protein [Minisyncoccota bacterium]
MVSPQLLDYIRQQLAAGVSKEEIVQSLITTGWQGQDINDAFSTIGTQPASVMTPGLTTQSPNVQMSAPTPVQPNNTRIRKSVWWVIAISLLLLIGAGAAFAAYYSGFFFTSPTAIPAASSTPPINTDNASTTLMSDNIFSALTWIPVASSTTPNPDNILLESSTTAMLGMKAENYYSYNGNVMYQYVVGRELDSFSIPGADASTFSVIRYFNDATQYAGDINYVLFAKDKSSVYCHGQLLKNSDANTFSIFPIKKLHSGGQEIYAKDKNNVYMGCNILPEADPATFQLLPFESMGTDMKGVKHDVIFYMYAKDSQHVYYIDQEPGSLIAGADAPSFSVIDTDLTKDKNHVYLVGAAIPNADPQTFSLIISRDGGYTQFAKDKNNVYWDNENQTIRGVDPSTFALVYRDAGTADGYASGYVKDKDHVWYFNECDYMCGPSYIPYEVVPGADSATFVGVSGQKSYDAQDKNNRYYMGKMVQ